MSDLSIPPLEWLPPKGDAAASGHGADKPGISGFAWPTPDLPGFPVPSCLFEPTPCRIEGHNGRITQGRLSAFDPEARRVHLLTPATRNPIPVRFDQFRRLTLDEPLQPVSDSLARPAGTSPVPTVSVQITARDGSHARLDSATPRQEAYGLFLFEPTPIAGDLRRSFVPSDAYTAVTIGRPIGELLVEQEAATPAVIEQALAEQAAIRSQTLGASLLERRVVSPEQLEEALAAQSRMPMVRIGEALIALGFITRELLDDALEQQKHDRSLPLGELLVRRGDITRDDLQMALARKMGYPVVDVRHFPTEPVALTKVPAVVARRLEVLPLMLQAGRIVVAMTDPGRRHVLEEVEFLAQVGAVPVLARGEDLPAAIEAAYDRIGLGRGTGARAGEDGAGSRVSAPDLQGATELLASLERQGAEQRQEADEPLIEQSDNSLVKLINQMIVEAQTQGVSDIHVETQPAREKVRIRFRKDGQLRPYLELPHTYRAALIARLKIMCDLDISERRKPQDGKINFGKFHPGARLELRLATIPTHGGLEDAVLRLLASVKPLPLDQLGLSPSNLAGLKAVLARPYGMILCVGPTGSGKTTTLHSALGHINRPDLKIWTAEDPIEITQSGLRQVQVNPKIDWTFAKALRAFLRADPDVVMVGEIRDQETAQMVIEASLTGHLVLSTLHTNSAAETVTRLLDMGMDPFNFADSLLGVLSQRLVRRLCSNCVVERDATDAEVDEWLDDYMHGFPDAEVAPSRDDVLASWIERFGSDGRLRHRHAPGCKRCDGGGHRGRTAIHEWMSVTRDLRRLIQTGGRAELMLATAQREGMRTLRQDGIEKVIAGLTSLEEVRANSNA